MRTERRTHFVTVALNPGADWHHSTSPHPQVFADYTENGEVITLTLSGSVGVAAWTHGAEAGIRRALETADRVTTHGGAPGPDVDELNRIVAAIVAAGQSLAPA